MSKGLEDVFIVLTRFFSSCREIGENLSRTVKQGGQGTAEEKDGLICAFMSLILPTKKERNLSHSSSEDNGILGDGEETTLLIVLNRNRGLCLF